MTISPPAGLAAIVTTFGDPRKFLRSDGTLGPGWESQNITRIPLPLPLPLAGVDGVEVSRITCHILLATFMTETLQLIADDGLWDSLVSYGGGFNWRPQRGSSKISTHAWGIAWDFDPDHNVMGEAPTLDPQVVDIFKSRGFTWGGGWSRPDGMHLQFASGY